MVRHVVLLRWNDDIDDPAAATADVVAALRALPAAIEAIRAYAVGGDIGLNIGNFDLAVVADFDDEAGYLAYRDHPAHQQVITDHIAPILAERAAVQYRVD